MDAWAVPSLLAVIVMAGLTFFVVARRPPSLLWPALPATFAAAALFAAGDLLSRHLAWSSSAHWLGLELLYAGLLLLTVSWWTLGLRFSQMHGQALSWGRSPSVRIPAIWNALLWAALVTNPWHGLFLEPHWGRRSDFHLLWYANTATSYVLAFATIALFLRVAMRVPKGNVRSQSLLLAAATATPLFGNQLYISTAELLTFDPMSLGLCMSCALFAAGIYREQLFSLSPVALADLMQQEADAILLLDRNGRLLHANPVAHRIFSPPELVVGSDVVSLLATRLRDPEAGEPAPARASILGTERGDAPRPNGVLFRSALPGLRWVRVQATSFRRPNGALTGHYLRIRDETALHEAVEAADERASVLDAVFNSTGDGFMVSELDGRVRYTNRRNFEILGLPTDEFQGTDVEKIVRAMMPKREDPSAMQQTAKMLREDPYSSVAGEFRLHDGRTIERLSHPLLHDGVPVGRIWRISDVTERVRAHESLLQAEKLESLRVMAGGIAHDFNNLLMAILGNAELAAAELPSESLARPFIEDVTKSAERASELTRQLLHYAGRRRVMVGDVDLSRLVSEATELIGVLVPKPVSVRYELAADLPDVTGDPAQLRQVLMNLVMNAIEAIGDSEGEISVATGTAERPAPKPGGTSQCCSYLRLRDTGCGMDAATRARIFDPFFSTKFTGRGLGLAAVQGIVRAHEGELQVESEPGRGSCFTLYLPCLAGVTPRPTPRPCEQEKRRGTVLVVDDDPGVASIAARCLRAAGLEVLTAGGGREAIALYRQRGPEIAVVLLDLTMPEMSGEETWLALRELDPGVRVILTSGYPEHAVPFPSDEGGHCSFLQKPYRGAELIERVRKWTG